MAGTIYTIGHSTHPAEDFLRILQAYSIQVLVDVRRFPQSRTNPQFNQAALRNFLQEHAIQYRHLEGLGGRRSVTEPELNNAWENAAFRGYADYMQTPAFAENLETLVQTASAATTTIMCAEAVPWRCHRSLIADALLVHGFQVMDILTENNSRPHQMTAWARVQGGRISYPKE